MEPPTYLSPSPASEVRGVLVVIAGFCRICTSPLTNARFSRPASDGKLNCWMTSEPQTCVRPLSSFRPVAVRSQLLSVTLPPTTEHPSAACAVAWASLLMAHGAAQSPVATVAQRLSKLTSKAASSGQNTQSVCAVVAPASSRSMAAARIMMVGQPLCCVRGQRTLARDYGPAMRLHFCTQLIIVFARWDILLRSAQSPCSQSKKECDKLRAGRYPAA